MNYWKLVVLVLTLIPSVYADDWDDFAGDVATDLAPLITLFGERLTKQFLSESIRVLDSFIFALGPLGILTAVVSVIRVCGNSSLRAFVGRAQEGPGEAENELLSCVSETTAELFNTGGISRVFGRPRILEIVSWEEEDDEKKVSLAIETLRQAIQKEVCSPQHGVGVDEVYPPAFDIPNLSLNMGIKIRSRVWSYFAAVSGSLLQIGVFVYSALTVFAYPDSFTHYDKAAPPYAFPFFVFGTTLLSTGMFLCAFIIERSSKKYYYSPTRPCKIYWLQPGRQTVGDQVFGAFMGVKENRGSGPSNGFNYIKSLKSDKYDEKNGHLSFTVSITILGFFIQFIGLRALHPSVIVAQTGFTLLMAIIRTCLRTKRINLKENRLSDEDRALTSHNQQELDCFAFHLENIESFDLRASTLNEIPESHQTENLTPKINKISIIQTRTKLAELTSKAEKSSNTAWDDLPIRKMAQNLARTIEMTMDLLSSWGHQTGRTFDFNLAFQCQPASAETDTHIERHTMRLERSDDTLHWRVNELELEAVLGLWTWSLLNSDSDCWLRNGLFRLVGLDETEAASEGMDLCFHKWIFRQTEARMVSRKAIDTPHRLFGYPSDDFLGETEILVVKTQNRVESMAAQDLYIRFLDTAFENLDELGGETDILSGSQDTFFAQNTHLDDLVNCFESGKLGSREDALLCIVPAIRHQHLLPDLAADSPGIRHRVEESIRAGKWINAFSITRWLCERNEKEEFERSVFELGSLCRRAMLHSDLDVRQTGFNEICNVLEGDIRAKYFERLRQFRKTQWMISQDQTDWWFAFSEQLGWMACHISKNQPNAQNMKSTLQLLGAKETLRSANTPAVDGVDAARNTDILLQWLTVSDDTSFAHELSESDNQSCFLWTLHRSYYAIATWLLIRWGEIGQHFPIYWRLAFVWAAASSSDSAIQTLCRHGGDINGIDRPPKGGCTALFQVVVGGNEGAARKLLENGADANSGKPSDQLSPLIFASQNGDYQLAQLLISFGATIDLRDWAGNSALVWASRGGHLDVVRLLLRKGADVNASAMDGMTSLLYAADKNHVSVLELLLDSGAEIEMTNENGRTALIFAAQENSIEATSVLLSRGANVHRTDLSEMTALDWAKHYQHQQVVCLLESAQRFQEL